MLLAPNRQRTRHRTSSVKHGVSSEDFRSHIKLDGWKNAYLSTNPDLVPFEGRAQKLADKLTDARVVGFLHLLLRYVLARVAAGTDCGLGGRVHPQIAWAKPGAPHRTPFLTLNFEPLNLERHEDSIRAARRSRASSCGVELKSACAL